MNPSLREFCKLAFLNGAKDMPRVRECGAMQFALVVNTHSIYCIALKKMPVIFLIPNLRNYAESMFYDCLFQSTKSNPIL